MDPTFWATVSGVIVTLIAVITALLGLRQQLRQNYNIIGAISAIEWRNQVIALHDRGLSPGEIRYIMYREQGGEGYEQANGSIDEIVRNIPRVIPSGEINQLERSLRRSIPQPGNLPFWHGGEKAIDQFDGTAPFRHHQSAGG